MFHIGIKIFKDDVLQQEITKVLSATLTDKVSGERTLEFAVIAPQTPAKYITTGQLVCHDNQYYDVVRVKRSLSDDIPISSVFCEHITYRLNNSEYDIPSFAFSGEASRALEQLLAGTPFTAGTVESATETINVSFSDSSVLNRRKALMYLVAACEGEIEYDEYKINIRRHRGSTVRKPLMDGTSVTDLSVTQDSRESVSAYELSLFKAVDLSAGDEVNITFTPLGISENTRIIGISYNPFYRYTVRVEVGDYAPDIYKATAKSRERSISKVRSEIRASDSRLSSAISSTNGNVSQLSQTVNGLNARAEDAEGNIASLELQVTSFSTRITSAEGNISSLEQTANSITTRISAAENDISGTKKSVSSLEQTANSITTRISENESSISGTKKSVSSLEQTANSITTRVSKNEKDISSLTQTATGFSTEIKNAKNDISKLTQTVDSISTQVSTADKKISEVTQTAAKISWLVKSGTSASNFELTDRAATLAASKIDLKGYVTISSLKTSGETVINGSNITTGKISAEYIDASTIKISKLTIGTKTAIDSKDNVIYIGGDNASNVFGEVYIKASRTINFTSWSSAYDGLSIDVVNREIRPNKDNYYSLGSSANSFRSLYSYAATIGDTYPLVIESRQLRPRTTNASYPWYIGNSSNPFFYGYFSNLYAKILVQLGSTSSAKVGFFGTTPIARKTVANNATVATLITALKAYGLIS